MIVALGCRLAVAQEDVRRVSDEVGYRTLTDIPYRDGEGTTDYMKERCRLDVYYPLEKKGYSTVVWFHGGGLKAGNRSVPKQLKGINPAI